MEAIIIAVDKVISQKTGKPYYRLWITTKEQPRPMRIISRKEHFKDEIIKLSIEPDYQCNAIVKVIE